MLNKFKILIWLIVILIIAIIVIGGYYVSEKYKQSQNIGGQEDNYGCLVAAGYSWCGVKNKCMRQWEEYCTTATPKTALFVCDDSKTIEATFYPTDDNYVDLVLSDGSKISLPHAISASGARYAKPDDSFVFWNKGNTAFITEGDATTFSNCVTDTQ